MSSNEQQEIIEKTLKTSDFLNGGELNPEQQTEFIRLVKKFSVLLPQVRFERMTNPQMDFDKMHLGEPVTEAVDEDTDTGNVSKPKFNKITLSTSKVRSAWNQSTEALQVNISQEALESQILDIFGERIATDMEDLFINGDSDLTGTDPVSRLRKRFDGVLKMVEETHVIELDGDTISKSVFKLMLRRMPKQYKGDPGMRWIVSDGLYEDWMDKVADRATAVGDAALGGNVIRPYGIPFLKVPLMPDDKSVEVGGASTARVIGSKYGPWIINSTNNKFKVDIDNQGAVTVTLQSGTFQAHEIAKMISDAYTAAHAAQTKRIARDDGSGLLLIESSTTGTGSEVDIQTVASNCYDTMGFEVDVTAGEADGSERVGTQIILANPKNFMFGMLNGTRMYSEFVPRFDRLENTVFNQIGTNIENKDAIVYLKGLRLQD